MKKWLLIAVIVFAGYTGFNQYQASPGPTGALSGQVVSSDSEFARAYHSRARALEIGGHGTVVKLLPDDDRGSRHQKFIVRLESGLTVLLAHNIDLAPRVASLNEGDSVNFYGQYEWNEKGGVIHWTHIDPNGFHTPGWIEHKGRKYQ